MIGQLEPIEFIGLAKLFGADLMRDDKPLPFDQVLEQVLDKFIELRPKRQKEILKLLSQPGKHHA